MNDQARPKLTDNLPRLYKIIFVISIGFLILGYLFEHPLIIIHLEWAGFEYIQKVAALLTTEIGIAGLVACGLGATIEAFSARESERAANRQRAEFREQSRQLAEEERENIKNDVFRAVFGNLIPKEITDEIISQVLKAKFVRKNLIMKYTLEPLLIEATEEKYIQVKLEMSYDILNITSEREKFPLGATLEVAPTEELAGEVKFINVTVTGSEQPFSLSEPEIPFDPTELRVKLKLNQEVWVPGNSSARIVVRSQTLKHYQGGSSYFLFGYHSCDLELSVLMTDKSLKVSADTFSENQELPQIKGDPAINLYKWKTNRPLLAFQGFYIAWRPIKPIKPVADSASLEPIEPITPIAQSADTEQHDNPAKSNGENPAQT